MKSPIGSHFEDNPDLGSHTKVSQIPKHTKASQIPKHTKVSQIPKTYKGITDP